MPSLKDLAEEFSLSDAEIAEVLSIPPSILKNGLKEYQYNEPVKEFFDQKIRNWLETKEP